ncbi:MAG: hypothetical protein WA110_00430 [Anaerolineaceae bacterium]
MQDEITPKTPIGGVDIFDPDIYDQLIESGNLGQSLLYGEDVINNLRP